MRLETFRGRDLTSVCAQARSVFGEDAIIVHTRTVHDGTRPWIEVEATAPSELATLQKLLVSTAPSGKPLQVSQPGRAGSKARMIALVGPTGAGKTTTLAKLAVHEQAFGAQRTGFITFDTYRAGAFDQLEAYAEAASLPCEIVYDLTELNRAIRRLDDCDVILIDTPGRGPRTEASRNGWRGLLRSLKPDETHLVIPATMRADLIARIRAEYGQLGVTHAVLTKLDEVPSDARVAEYVTSIGLPMRWITDGQDVPSDLRFAAPSVLGALGMSPATLGAA